MNTVNFQKINEIRSVKARNILRGVFGNSSISEAKKLLNRIKRECSVKDYKMSSEIIRGHSIFENNPIGRYFNKFFPSILDDDIQFSIDEIAKSIKYNKVKLLDLMASCNEVLMQLAKKDYAAALGAATDVAKDGGVSIFLLRCLYFVRNHNLNDVKVIKEIDDTLSELNVGSVKYVSLAIRELSSPKTDYFNICEKINNSANGVLNIIAKNFIDHVPRNKKIFIETFGAYYKFSILDAFLYYKTTCQLELPFCYDLMIEDEELSNGYHQLVNVDIEPQQFYEKSDELAGVNFFREAFLLIEQPKFFKYRTVHGSIYNRSDDKDLHRIPLERIRLNDHFMGVSTISGIGNGLNGFELNISKYRTETACNFENSNALIYCLEKKGGQICDEELEFVRLMSATRDIGVICPRYYIKTIIENAKRNELKLVATCLHHIKEASQLNEHDLRRVIQEIVVSDFDFNITALLDYIYEKSPSVTEHLIQICDEPFLSKLFQVVRNPNDAIENRANIFAWYGNKIGDQSYLERAKNLRIDVQINKEKGTIDDSRIYVDPVRFTQWITDRNLSKLTILLENIYSETDVAVVTINWEKVKIGISHFDQVGSILLDCYEEFCSNKIYGIASYLGRRIRHGTFKGTGIKEVRDFASDEKNEKLFLNKEFEDAFNSWMKNYELALDQLRDRHLHIQEKSKPDGLISKEFKSNNKRATAHHMMQAVINSFSTNKNGLEIPYIITEYCWRLIEEDLTSVRKFLMESKARCAVFRFDGNVGGRSHQREIQEFCQELNAITADKFRMISMWFNKPSIASPAADVVLLFKAVVSEVKGLFNDYTPDVVVNECSFPISGGLYFVIYDALYILIYNAARYGKKEGTLEMKLSIDYVQKLINIAIISEMLHDCEAEKVELSILSALQEDCEDALVVEGRSGIKKLKRLEQDNYIQGVKYWFENGNVCSSFNFGVDC